MSMISFLLVFSAVMMISRLGLLTKRLSQVGVGDPSSKLGGESLA